jgi:protein involved in polysaccharide export with SLBB domain
MNGAVSHVLILALALAAGPLRAAGPSASGAGPEAAGAYRLRPDDQIDITVLGLTQLDKAVTILPDGTFTYPRLGTIHAAGMTPQELQRYLYKGLDRFYNNLDVTVTVKALRVDHVAAQGAVKSPNLYPLGRGWTVRELLAAAGGLALTNGPPAPDQMRATLIRKSGERIALNMAQLLSEQGAADLPTLDPDDVLSVEDMSIQVWVDGQVKTPGKMWSLPPGGSPLDALRLAGGPTEQAALTQAKIRRGSDMIPVNLYPLVNGQAVSAALPPLQRFDQLFIPENKDQFVVMGGVNKPARYAIPEGTTVHVSEALVMAGGTVQHAKLKEVSLVQKAGGKPVATKVDVDRIVRGDVSRDVIVHPGDTIYVPDPKQPRGVPIWTILQGAALLFGL